MGTDRQVKILMESISKGKSYSASSACADKKDASLLFQLVTHRYERRSIIVTTNVAFTDWDQWLGDTVIASAILDRLLHHADIVAINGESYRIGRKDVKDR